MNIWTDCEKVALPSLLSFIVDNRGKTVPTSKTGHILIATNCIKNDHLFPVYEKVRFLSQETYDTFFRAHPIPGDIIFVNKGTPGRCALVPDPVDFCIAQDMMAFRVDNSKVNNIYLLAVLRSYEIQRLIYSISVGDVIPHFKKQMLDKIQIPLPPLEVQNKIASYFSDFNHKIENNRKICANLEAQAQALFKHWFIDFAPFKDGKFVESELGMIPEGWRVGRLFDYVDNLSGYSYKGSELQPSTIAMATIKNFVRGGGFKTEGYKEIVISKVIKDYQYINLFDVLVAHTDLTQNAEVVGNPAIVLSTAGYDKLIMSMDLTKVVSKDKRLTSPLIHSILSTRKFKEHALGYVNGTTVLHMSKKAVPEYTLAMPINLDVLKELTSGLNDLYQMMSETYAENLLLSTLRDTLLPKLMSGELRVNDIETN